MQNINCKTKIAVSLMTTGFHMHSGGQLFNPILAKNTNINNRRIFSFFFEHECQGTIPGDRKADQSLDKMLLRAITMLL